LRHQTMDKVQKYNSFNTNTPSSESYRNYSFTRVKQTFPAIKERQVSLLGSIPLIQCCHLFWIPSQANEGQLDQRPCLKA